MIAPAGTTATTSSSTPSTRPRVEGARETEILGAALTVLGDVGYDRFTFDLVATAAKASKATLYRRWPHKRDLIVEALGLLLGCPADADPATGSLRDDLLGQACAQGGLVDDRLVATWGALLPALHRDPELMAQIQSHFVSPKLEASRQVFRNAQARGEIGPGADLDSLVLILPALSFHEALLTGRHPDRSRIEQFVDTVVLPACAATLG